MTDDEINIAIAEACGWTFVDFQGTILCREPEWEAGRAKTLEAIPDYCNDLNAMHEAWETLTLAKKRQFEIELYKVIIGDGDYNRNDDAMKITNAIARQRAEVFLRTLNLWNND